MSENILECWDRTGSYWECWLERAQALFPDDLDPVSKIDLTWGIGAVQNALLAYFLQEESAQLNKVKPSIKSLKEILDSNDFLYWERSPFPDERLIKIRNVAGLAYGMTWGDWLTITTRSYYLMMGFSNVREFYAWGAMLLMWAYGITRDPLLKNKSVKMLDNFVSPPSNIPTDLLKTPSNTNPKVQKEFADRVYNAVQEEWSLGIKPFLYDSRLENIRVFVSEEFGMTKDTIAMAVRHKGYKKEETFSVVPMLITVLGVYAGYKIISSD